jgi:predicted dehydrogenase
LKIALVNPSSGEFAMIVNRREFARLGVVGSVGLASGLAPSVLGQSSGKKVGYAIIGLGRIAGHFMEAIQQSPNSKVTALVSGHRDKAERIAEKYGVPKSSIYNYENMDAFRDNKDVDAVYVALPNSMHAEYTIRSAKAGKHVLCEKPMSATVKEAEEMIAACKAANVKLMIAYRCHYEPTNLKAIKMIRDGNIGEVQSIQSAFGFSCNPTDWRLSKPLAGGGPMMDVGIYSLNATRYLTGEEPAGITAYTHTSASDPRFKTVEENIVWTTKFPSGILATCNTTYGAPMQGYYRVHGSKGVLEVTEAFSYEGLVLKAEYEDAQGKRVKVEEATPEKDPAQFVREADHFSDCVLKNLTPKTTGDEGLKDLTYIRQIYQSAGIQMA